MARRSGLPAMRSPTDRDRRRRVVSSTVPVAPVPLSGAFRTFGTGAAETSVREATLRGATGTSRRLIDLAGCGGGGTGPRICTPRPAGRIESRRAGALDMDIGVGPLSLGLRG